MALMVTDRSEAQLSHIREPIPSSYLEHPEVPRNLSAGCCYRTAELALAIRGKDTGDQAINNIGIIAAVPGIANTIDDLVQPVTPVIATVDSRL